MTRSVPLSKWPEQDRQAWLAAVAPADFLDETGRAANWSSMRKEVALRNAGAFLAWRRSHGLAADQSMTTQATPDLLVKFAQAERQRGLKLRSVATALLNIVGVLGTLDPAMPTAAHYRLCRRVKAASQREAPAERFLVDPVDLLEVGLHLLDTAVDVKGDVIDVDAWQDGLLLALLTVAPMRMANLSAMQVGQQLVQRGEAWCIDLDACETKTRQGDLWPLPPWLAPYLQHHVEGVRLHMMSPRTRECDPGAVWIDRFGERLRHQGIRQRIKARTTAAFGKAVLPHSFRHCAATAFSWSYPDRPRDAAALLGHGSPRTTEKHYIRSQRQLAVAELHRMIEERKRRRSMGRSPAEPEVDADPPR